MAVDRNAASLIALNAVVLDTETTGLDPRTARVVEIAAVRLVSGRLDTGAPFRRLVQPGEPLSASATLIHGIDAAAVAGSPAFAEVWPEFSVYHGGAVLIGHAIGFDCAVLARECSRIGKTWQPPLTLDTQMLAQIAEPELAGYSLENLAAWAGRRNHQPPLGLGRCHRRRTDLLRAGPAFARAGHQDARGSDARLSRFDERA